MRTVAIVQARMGSSRLPDKVMKLIGGRPMIELLLARLSAATKLDEIVIAISADTRNQPLADCVNALGYHSYMGSEKNVLDRFYQSATEAQAEIVVRITADCPLIDPGLVDEVISAFETGDADYVSNISPPSYPNGLDTEVFSFQSLQTAWEQSRNDYDREHVTPYIRESGQFKTGSVQNDEDFSALRWTVDEAPDFAVVSRVFEHFAPSTDFGWREILELQQQNPELFADNQHVGRNEG